MLGPRFEAQSLFPRMTSTGRSQCSMSFLETRPSRRERSPEIPCEPTTTTAASRSRAMSINVSATSTSSGTACGSAASPRAGELGPVGGNGRGVLVLDAINRFDRRRIRR
jgi:hypothetical protein